MATKEFACDKCGTFLTSVDGAVAICRCDGAFHAPAEVEPYPEALPEVLFPDTPPMEEEAATSATFSPMPKMADETEKPKRRRSRTAKK